MLNTHERREMEKPKSGPKKGSKRSPKIRLRVTYEAANEQQRATAIMLLASMYREVAERQQLKETEKKCDSGRDANLGAAEVPSMG